MKDKIILKFKTKNILNFYEIEPRCLFVIYLKPDDVWNQYENTDLIKFTLQENMHFLLLAILCRMIVFMNRSSRVLSKTTHVHPWTFLICLLLS